MPDRKKDFAALEACLRKILQRRGAGFAVKSETANGYSLYTGKSPRFGKELMFGATKIGKNYVSFYFMPIYMCAEMQQQISPGLRKRMQGKACFNFTEPEAKLFEDLDDLVRKGREFWERTGILPA